MSRLSGRSEPRSVSRVLAVEGRCELDFVGVTVELDRERLSHVGVRDLLLASAPKDLFHRVVGKLSRALNVALPCVTPGFRENQRQASSRIAKRDPDVPVRIERS